MTRTARRLGLTGAALMIVAVVSWVGLALSNVDGYRWPKAALVAVDGQSHSLTVPEGRTAMVWTYQPDATPDCTFVDSYGSELPTTATDGAYRREGGSAGDWKGTATFEPTSATVDVTCAPRGPSGSLVAIEAAPRMPPALAGFGALIGVPLGFGIAGILAIIIGAIVTRRRPAAS